MQTNTMQSQVKYSQFTEEEKAILGSLSQETKVRNHFERYGQLTQRDAYELYGIQRLAAIVEVLRNKREPRLHIETVMEAGKNRFGQQTHYARYFYKGEEE